MTTARRRIVVLTGAGVSAESGLKTFRAADGLWENHRVEDVASMQGFLRNPQLVQEFYNQRRKQLLHAAVQPNPAHIALAELAAQPDIQLTLITQNIDDLHERGGSNNVLHMHGELLQARCQQCQQIAAWRTDITSSSVCKNCKKVATLRPNIVWFGEMPLYLDTIDVALDNATVFVAIGTAGNVCPAAQFVQIANARGIETLELNIAITTSSNLFRNGMYGSASKIVPHWVKQLRNL